MDFIDKRDKQEKMAKSIIKRRNVVYTYPREIGQKGREETALESEEEARDILKRLEQEQRADEERLQQEIEQLLMEQEKNQAEIDRIMKEKQKNLEKTVKEASEKNDTM